MRTSLIKFNTAAVDKEMWTFVLLVMAASTAGRSEMSTKVVWMPHFSGRKDFSSAKVPPAGGTDWSPHLLLP